MDAEIASVDPDELLRPRDAARLLGLTERSLENFRTRGSGPEYERLTPKVIRYSRRALREWRAAHAVRSTAEYARLEGDDAA